MHRRESKLHQQSRWILTKQSSSSSLKWHKEQCTTEWGRNWGPDSCYLLYYTHATSCNCLASLPSIRKPDFGDEPFNGGTHSLGPGSSQTQTKSIQFANMMIWHHHEWAEQIRARGIPRGKAKRTGKGRRRISHTRVRTPSKFGRQTSLLAAKRVHTYTCVYVCTVYYTGLKATTSTRHHIYHVSKVPPKSTIRLGLHLLEVIGANPSSGTDA